MINQDIQKEFDKEMEAIGYTKVYDDALLYYKKSNQEFVDGNGKEYKNLTKVGFMGGHPSYELERFGKQKQNGTFNLEEFDKYIDFMFNWELCSERQKSWVFPMLASDYFFWEAMDAKDDKDYCKSRQEYYANLARENGTNDQTKR